MATMLAAYSNKTIANQNYQCFNYSTQASHKCSIELTSPQPVTFGAKCGVCVMNTMVKPVSIYPFDSPGKVGEVSSLENPSLSAAK